MQIMHGVAVNSGLHIGTAKIINPKSYNITHKYISEGQISEEETRFELALHHIEQDILNYLNSSDINESDKDIFRTHMLILQDPDINIRVINGIRDKLYSAAQAVYSTYEEIAKQFQDLENEFFALRVTDYKDIGNRLIAQLLDEVTADVIESDADIVYLMREITPSMVTRLGKNGIKAYCAEKGSLNSHCSILTRALNIVAIVSLPSVMTTVRDGDLLVIDGFDGILTINPDSRTLDYYHQLQNKYISKQAELSLQRDLNSETISGRKIDVRANIELPEELDAIVELGCDGIGLFRTEFLYLNRDKLPSEEEQTEIYRDLLSKMAPQPVTIRTFDLGGDKLSHLLNVGKEDNPNLGNRGIRFSLAHPELFRTQIRAILKASVAGSAKIMFPMVIDAADFIAAKSIVFECMQQFEMDEVAYDHEIPLGVMIEIPSAALCSADLAEVADFFSIGTNDLVQYTLAVDRNNDAVSKYYVQHHPAVLSLIRQTLSNAKAENIPVSICGEMASMPEYIPLFCGMGMRELSVNPNRYFQVKAIIRKCDEKLDEMVQNFDFSSSLKAVEKLIFQDMKAYYDF